MSQQELFNLPKSNKSYRAIRHDVVRSKQAANSDCSHHPTQKKDQIKRVLRGDGMEILELFAGKGNLTELYAKHGNVTRLDKKLDTGDSFTEYHRFIADKRKFDVVDVDPYGFPSRLLPDVFLLIDSGFLFITCPMPSVNILHDITKTHLYAYFGSDNPTHDEIAEKIALYGLCHWRRVELIDSIKMDRMYRMVFQINKVKATEYTGVINR